MVRWRRLGFLAVCCWWAADLALAASWASWSIADDYGSYWATGWRVLHGFLIYPPSQLASSNTLLAHSGVGFVYPPPAALLTVPLALLPLGIGFGLFVALSATAWVLVVSAILRRSSLHGTSLHLAMLLMTVNGPVLDGLVSGQANVLLAALLGLAWLRVGSAGYVAVASGLLKPSFGGGLVWARRQRPWGQVLGPLALGVGAVALATIALGPTAWARYLAVVAQARPIGLYYLPSPERLLEGYLSRTAVVVVLAALTIGLLLLVHRVRDDAVAFALLGWAVILPAPDWWAHYLLFPLVAMLPLVLRWVAPKASPLPAPALNRGRRAPGGGRAAAGDRSKVDPKGSATPCMVPARGAAGGPSSLLTRARPAPSSRRG